MTPAQLFAVRQAYSDAFKEDMRVCAIVSGIGILFTLVSFRRRPEPVWEVRKKAVEVEQRRLKTLREGRESFNL